jgi:hypothetical protein
MNNNKFQRKGPISRKINPDLSDIPIDPIFSQRLERVNRAHLKYSIEYNPSNYGEAREDRTEVKCQEFMKQYAQSHEIQLLSLKRVLLKYDQFEDDNGDIVKGKRSAIVAKILVNVYEP